MSKKTNGKRNQKASDLEALDQLHDALSEWTPEDDAAASGSTEKAEAAPSLPLNPSPQPTPVARGSGASVVLIEDPFGITPSSDDVLDEPMDEDLELSSPESEVSEESEESEDSDAIDMESLRKAMSAEQDRQVTELVETVGEEEEDAKARLAREIAEDQALQAESEREAAAALEADPELRAALPGVPQIGEDGELDLRELGACIETLLFISDKPFSPKKLQDMLGEQIPFSAIQEALTQLKDRYAKPDHGIELAEVGGGFQLRTKPIRAPLAKKLARVVTQRLSTGAMETLAIVAYKQPVMKEDIDQVRGVDSSHFIRTLLDRKLARIAGRSELPGRPMLYATSEEFLEVFGLKDLDALPPLRELESMIPASQSGSEDEDPRVKQMRKLVHEMKTNSASILDYDPKDDEKFLQDIRDKVNSIPTSTATLDAQKEAEKAAKEARAAGKTVEPAANAQGQYGLPQES